SARTLKVTAPISGPSSLIIGVASTSTGVVSLAAAETYLGSTTVNVGTLQLLPGGSLPASTSVTLGSSSFATSALFVLGDASGAVSSNISGLTVSGTGTANAVVGGNASVSALTINNSGPDTFSGLLGGAG